MIKNLPAPDNSRILIYQSDSGNSRLDVRLQDETVWLTQRLMAELFQVSVKTVNEHLMNIYVEVELERELTIPKFRIVQTEGNRRVSRLVEHYNDVTLDSYVISATPFKPFITITCLILSQVSAPKYLPQR